MLPSDGRILSAALRIARAEKVGGDDAIDVATSRELGIPLLTADAKLPRHFTQDRRVRSSL